MVMKMIKLSSGEQISEIKEKEHHVPRYMSLGILTSSILLGLVFNWISFYMSIILGILSIGAGPFIILLLVKVINRRKELTDSHFALITIAYRGTTAAEATTGLLFIIWLTQNSQLFFKMDFSPPWWLLPSPEILTNRIFMSTEWIVPLLVHWFLMLIPGLLGVSFGWAISERFLEDEKEYRFPGIIQTRFLIEAVTSKDQERKHLFLKFAVLGFMISMISTIALPSIDLSSNKMVLGVTLGIVGTMLFAVGFIMKMPKITIGSLFWSIVFYVIISSFTLPINFKGGQGFLEVHNSILSTLYLAFLIGLLIGALFLRTLLQGIIQKNPDNKRTHSQNDSHHSAKKDDAKKKDSMRNKTVTSLTLRSLEGLIRRHYKLLAFYILLYFISLAFVLQFNLLSIPPYLMALLLLWILIIGNIMNGYIVTQTLAKSSSTASVPFVFDLLPLYLANARDLLPYVAIPKAEPSEVSSIVSSLKLGQIFHIRDKEVITTYLAGYLAAIITTPFFALLLWHVFGIGTDNLPSPAFPLIGSLLAAFASGEPLTFFNPSEMGLGIVVGLIIGPNFGLGAILGLLFPLPMTIPLAIGGTTRYLADKIREKELVEQQWQFAMTALAAGASLVVLPLILLALLF